MQRLDRGGLLLPLALVAACTTPPPASRSQAAVTQPGSRLLPWGEVGHRPAQPERLAEGPSAVAVAADNSVLVLDRLNGRVLRLTEKEVTVAATVPEDAEDLAAGPDGALAVYSPLRARVWVHGPSGEPIGQLAVPRILRNVRGIALGPSRVVWLEDAHQERLPLGSPSAPQTLEAMLHGKQEGAALLADKTAVATRRLPDGRPELLLVDRDGRVLQAHPLGRPVLATRVVGTAGQTTCLRLERNAGPGPVLVVARQAVCLDKNGRVLLSRDLPPPGSYVPRRELAVGGDPPRLAMIHPEADGLRVHTWPLEVSP
jgi:hypothetical protein